MCWRCVTALPNFRVEFIVVHHLALPNFFVSLVVGNATYEYVVENASCKCLIFWGAMDDEVNLGSRSVEFFLGDQEHVLSLPMIPPYSFIRRLPPSSFQKILGSISGRDTVPSIASLNSGPKTFQLHTDFSRELPGRTVLLLRNQYEVERF